MDTCVSCPKGYRGLREWATSFLVGCGPCDPGRFSDKFGSKDCQQCDKGKWSNTHNATSSDTCIPCEPGETGDVPGAIEKASCKACMAGMFAPKPGHAGPACDMCTPGKYQEKHRATECKACGYGRYTIEEGLSDPFKCQNCSAGRWSDTLEARFSADCQPCAVGKYSTEIGLGIDRDAPQSPPSSDDTDYPLEPSKVCRPGKPDPHP